MGLPAESEPAQLEEDEVMEAVEEEQQEAPVIEETPAQIEAQPEQEFITEVREDIEAEEQRQLWKLSPSFLEKHQLLESHWRPSSQKLAVSHAAQRRKLTRSASRRGRNNKKRITKKKKTIKKRATKKRLNKKRVS